MLRRWVIMIKTKNEKQKCSEETVQSVESDFFCQKINARTNGSASVVTSGYAMVVHGRPKTPKNTSFLGVTQPPGVAEPL